MTECPEADCSPSLRCPGPVSATLTLTAEASLWRLCDHCHPLGSGLNSAARQGSQQGSELTLLLLTVPGAPASHRLLAVAGHTPSGALSAIPATGDTGPQTSTLLSSLFWKVIFTAKPSLPTLPKSPTPPNFPQHWRKAERKSQKTNGVLCRGGGWGEGECHLFTLRALSLASP